VLQLFLTRVRNSCYRHVIDPAYQPFQPGRRWQSPVRDRNSRRILQATQEFVQQHGLEQLSMRRLASDIDVSVRTLYNLFGDKGGLLAALAQHSLDNVGAAVGEITADDPIERLWQGVTISVQTMACLPKAVVLALMTDEQLHDRLDWRARELNIDTVRSAIAGGELRDDLEPEVLVDHAGAVYRHILHLWANSKIDDAELLAGVLHAYDLACLSVARPRARKRLLEHLLALGQASNRWREVPHVEAARKTRPSGFQTGAR
jgi:AcrR family transcriptional regulator